jgi:hypothetical protein
VKFIAFIAITGVVAGAWAQSANVRPKSAPPATAQAPIDQLIPWLLDEDQQLRGVPFSEVLIPPAKKSFPLMHATQSISASQKRSAPPPMRP